MLHFLRTIIPVGRQPKLALQKVASTAVNQRSIVSR
jgi:hypothetical protein